MLKILVIPNQIIGGHNENAIDNRFKKLVLNFYTVDSLTRNSIGDRVSNRNAKHMRCKKEQLFRRFHNNRVMTTVWPTRTTASI